MGRGGKVKRQTLGFLKKPSFKKAGLIAVLAYFAWNGWQALGPNEPVLDTRRQAMATDIISDLAEDLRLNAAKPSGNTVLLHFMVDDSGFFTSELRRCLEQRGTLRLTGETFGAKLENVIGLSPRQYSTSFEAIEKGRELDASAVLFGRINRLESYPGGGIADIEVYLLETSDGGELFSAQYSIDTSQDGLSGTEIEVAVQRSNWLTKLVIWGIIIILLPVLSFAFIRSIVKKESNLSNALILAILMIVDLALAFMIPLTAFNGWLATIIFILLAISAFAYNTKMMAFAARLENE